jgi:plasmid stabilization system protein ParE
MSERERGMVGTVQSPLAKRDLVDIWVFIAKDNPDAADRFLDHLT